jgi:hypothetical protein
MTGFDFYLISMPCPVCGVVWVLEDVFTDIICDCGSQLRFGVTEGKPKLTEIHTVM